VIIIAGILWGGQLSDTIDQRPWTRRSKSCVVRVEAWFAMAAAFSSVPPFSGWKPVGWRDPNTVTPG
jgi:hypothetical protein